MAEFTKGKLETDQSCCNCIDILSKEDGSIVAQIMECDEDELSATQRANAEELVQRWNSHDDLLAVAKETFDCDYDLPKALLDKIKVAIAQVKKGK